MITVHPYLNFNGKTEEAFNFYKSVFGGEFTALMRFSDMPDSEKIPAEHRDKIMHVSMQLGNAILMGSDAIEDMGHTIRTGNHLYISLSVDSREEADGIFNPLSAGGKIEMPMEDAFWGDYFGSFIDKFGVGWMIAYDTKKEKK